MNLLKLCRAAVIIGMMGLVLGLAQNSQAAYTWHTRILDNYLNTGQYPALILDDQGFPVMTYYQITNGDLMLLRCDDAYCVGDAPLTLVSAGDAGYVSSIQLDASNNPVIAYFDETADDLMLIHCDDPYCLGTETPNTIDNSSARVGIAPSMVLDANGYPVISYLDDSNGNLRIAHCNDANCAGNNESLTSPDNTLDYVGQYSSIQLDANGFPVVVYFDDSNVDLKFMHCNDVNCAGANEFITTLDSDGVTGIQTSMQLDAAGNPVISYLQGDPNWDLKFVHCDDPNCVSDVPFLLDGTGTDRGYASSLELDSNGNPVISYYDLAAKLILLECTNPGCTGEQNPETVDDTDISGFGIFYTSLELDQNDEPVIAYRHVADAALKFARPGDPELDDPTPVDFNGDDDSEVVVFRSGAWHLYNYADASVLASIWTGTGGSSPRPLMMDYDGDGADDLTVFVSEGAWHFYNDDGSYNKGIWIGGVAGDLPVPADYDGDGDDDVVVFRSGAWMWFDFVSGAWNAAKSVWTGTGTGSPARPAPMDYDGDGDADFTVVNSGAWHFFNYDGSYNKGIWVAYTGGIPVPGDYDMDGDDDPMIFDGGAWHWFDFATGNYLPGQSVFTGTPAHKYGGTTLPAPLDYDGDGEMDFGMYAGGPWHFYDDAGVLVKTIATGGVLGDVDVSARPSLP